MSAALIYDLRHAICRLGAAPGFSLAPIGMLARIDPIKALRTE
jgi:hypothetical protein